MRLFFGKDAVGSLTFHGGTERFQYDEAWVNRSEAFPVSLSLPIRHAPFEGRELRRWMNGLAPLGVRRDRTLAELMRTFGDDMRDLPGAISIDGTARSGSSTRPLEAADIDRGIRTVAIDTMIGERRDTAAITSVSVGEWGEFLVPQDGAAGSHYLLTFPRMEALTSTKIVSELAEGVMIDTVPSTVHLLDLPDGHGGLQCLVYPRYDRRVIDGIETRLHCETFSQSLGGDLVDDEGNHLPQMLDLLRRYGRADKVWDLWRRYMFHGLVGSLYRGADVHTLLLTSSGVDLAPMAPVFCELDVANAKLLRSVRLREPYQYDLLSKNELRHDLEQCGLRYDIALREVKAMVGALVSKSSELLKQAQAGELRSNILQILTLRFALLQSRVARW